MWFWLRFSFGQHKHYKHGNGQLVLCKSELGAGAVVNSSPLNEEKVQLEHRKQVQSDFTIKCNAETNHNTVSQHASSKTTPGYFDYLYTYYIHRTNQNAAPNTQTVQKKKNTMMMTYDNDDGLP